MRSLVVRGPRDVPSLRRYLLHHWQQGGAFQATAALWRATHDGLHDGVDMNRSAAEAGVTISPVDRWERQTLADASLWWVSADMCDLLNVAEKSIPDDTLLEAELLPRPTGLIVFEKPIYGLDAEGSGLPIRVDALLWGRCNLPPVNEWTGGAAIGLSSYQRLNADDGLGPKELERAVTTGAIQAAQMDAPTLDGDGMSMMLHGDFFVPLGRADWRIGHDVLDRHAPFTDSQLASMIEDRRRMAALWLLVTQQGIATQAVDHGSRAERRREERETGAPRPPVTIVDIRRVHHEPTEGESEPSGRHLTVRFPVSGHWRRQAYGPKHAYRRPTWIAAHIRGPADAPFKTGETVQVFKSYTPPEPQ